MPPSEAPLRIAMVVPPFIRVPPDGYGGTELVVADLSAELARRGHHVSLFASGDSQVPGCETRWTFDKPIWPIDLEAEREHATFALAEIQRDEFDVVHVHSPTFLALAATLRLPMVATVHLPPETETELLFRTLSSVRFICISHRQRELYGSTFRGPEVIHHGLDIERYKPGSGAARHALFLGRLDAVKAPHLAVAAAREVGLPLHLAGRPHDGNYFEETLAPEIAHGGAHLIGEVSGQAKIDALGDAAVVLFPSVWEEPFGLAVIEAMLCGTPVVALRRGAMPELVDVGVTGYLAEDPDDLADAIRSALALDRAAIRERARTRFAVARMTDEYLAAFRRCLQAFDKAGTAWPMVAADRALDPTPP